MTSLALSPSGPWEGESVIEPSAPVNTFAFAMIPLLLENQRHGDEVDAEGRRQDGVDDRPPVDLVLTRRPDVQRVVDEGLVLHHRGEEAVDRARQRRAHALVVQSADERVAGQAN